MGGMGEKGDSMYSYVSKKVVRKQKKTCRKALIAANAILREKYNLQPHLVTVGSGSKYLVTKWDDEPFDLDFNLVFYTLPHEYIVQPMLLKNTLRAVLDQVLIKRGFTHGKDSTSVLTYSHKKASINLRDIRWILAFFLASVGL